MVIEKKRILNEGQYTFTSPFASSQTFSVTAWRGFDRLHLRSGDWSPKHSAELIDALYRREWSYFRNFFCPVMKHLRTEIKGSRKRRIYDQPATPFARLKASPQADPLQLARLEKLLATLDPFTLKQQIERKLRALLRHEIRRSFAQAA